MGLAPRLPAKLLWSAKVRLVGIKVEAKQRQKEGGNNSWPPTEKITRNIVERISI
jgi:hypothetical protein